MREQNQAQTIRDIHRINAIRNRIAGKVYEVDAQQIADKIIHLEKALSGKK